MRKASQDLFHLIQSMSAEECDFFEADSRQFKGNKDSNNMRLFHAIQGQPSYDEGLIKTQAFPEMTDNQFAAAKKYLYNSILKSLSAFLGDRGGIKQIRQMLRQVEVLFHKELMDQAQKRLDRCLQPAVAYDHPPVILDVLEWQRRIWLKTHFNGISQSTLDQHFSLLEKTLIKVNDLGKLQELHTNFMFALRKGGFMKNTALHSQQFEQLIQSPLLQTDPQSYPPTGKMAFYHTWGLYHTLTGKPDAAFQALEALVNVMHGVTDLGDDYYEFYVSAQYNFATTCLRLDRYEDVKRSIALLENIKATFSSQKAKLFVCLYLLNVEVNAAHGKMELAFAQTLEAKKKLPGYRHLLTTQERISIGMTMAFILFLHSKFSDCNRLINEEMSPDVIGDNPDLQVAVEVMRIVLFFEMEEYELLEHTYRSFVRFVQKAESNYALELFLTKALYQQGVQSNLGSSQAFFRDLREAYQTMKQDPNQNRPVEYINFGLWLYAKAEQMSLIHALDALSPIQK